MITSRHAFASTFLLLGVLGVASPVEASSIIFTPAVITAKAGNTITLSVVVDPQGSAQYTTRLALNFPSDLLEVTSFAFNPSWIALSQPGYDLIDNTRGELVKTAGFPNGFSSPVPFGTITLRAKGSGESVLNLLPQSFTLDGENKSSVPSSPGVRVVIAPTSAPSVPVVVPPKVLPKVPSTLPSAPPPTLPSETAPLFDLVFEPIQGKVGPGELFPVSVRLSNFGAGARVDVHIMYRILSSTGEEIYATSETVAVETTAHFIKTLQIPFGTLPGTYTARTSITYAGQVAPATAQFPFTVERKVFGLFRSAFFLYGGITLLISILAALLGYSLVRRRRPGRLAPLEYGDIPKGERVYYEIISDTIAQMRERAGDRALEVALHIKGLDVEEKTGRVLALSENPAKVVAELVAGYEKALGKQVSFSLRKEKNYT